MADLNIRNIPDELLRSLKVDAQRASKTLRQFVIDRLSGAEHLKPTMPRAEARKPVGEPVGVTEDYGAGKAPESVRKPKLTETDEPLNIGARYKAFMEAKRGKKP